MSKRTSLSSKTTAIFTLLLALPLLALLLGQHMHFDRPVEFAGTVDEIIVDLVNVDESGQALNRTFEVPIQNVLVSNARLVMNNPCTNVRTRVMVPDAKEHAAYISFADGSPLEINVPSAGRLQLFTGNKFNVLPKAKDTLAFHAPDYNLGVVFHSKMDRHLWGVKGRDRFDPSTCPPLGSGWHSGYKRGQPGFADVGLEKKNYFANGFYFDLKEGNEQPPAQVLVNLSQERKLKAPWLVTARRVRVINPTGQLSLSQMGETLQGADFLELEGKALALSIEPTKKGLHVKVTGQLANGRTSEKRFARNPLSSLWQRYPSWLSLSVAVLAMLLGIVLTLGKVVQLGGGIFKPKKKDKRTKKYEPARLGDGVDNAGGLVEDEEAEGHTPSASRRRRKRRRRGSGAQHASQVHDDDDWDDEEPDER